MQLHRPSLERAKLSFKAIAQALAAFVHPEPLPFDASALQRELDAALPAEPTWDHGHFQNYKAAPTAWPCLGNRSSDGLWICCCGHENSLNHYQGQAPFKYLECGKCNHVLCAGCSTTEILTLVSPLWVESDKTSRSCGPVRYCSVCTGCGLSHRASMHGGHPTYHEASCPCEARTGNNLHYYIGAFDEWRKDPAGQAEALRLDRITTGKPRIRAGLRRVPTRYERQKPNPVQSDPVHADPVHANPLPTLPVEDGRILRPMIPDGRKNPAPSDVTGPQNAVKGKNEKRPQRKAQAESLPPQEEPPVSPAQTQPPRRQARVKPVRSLEDGSVRPAQPQLPSNVEFGTPTPSNICPELTPGPVLRTLNGVTFWDGRADGLGVVRDTSGPPPNYFVA